jgi:hypothetical protein
MAAGTSPCRRLPVDTRTSIENAGISTIGSDRTKERNDYRRGDTTARNERLYCGQGERSDRTRGVLTAADWGRFVAAGWIVGLILVLRNNLLEFSPYRAGTID